MDLIGIEQNTDGTSTFSYNETPLMSTYLLAFAVGKYDYLVNFEF